VLTVMIYQSSRPQALRAAAMLALEKESE